MRSAFVPDFPFEGQPCYKTINSAATFNHPLLLQLAEGKPVTLSAELTEKFIDGYFAHIAVEEKELLPLAEYLLKPNQLDVLGASMVARRNVTEY